MSNWFFLCSLEGKFLVEDQARVEKIKLGLVDVLKVLAVVFALFT